MRQLLIIGIGAGNPEHMTLQAVNALQRVDVLFVTDKGQEKEELVQARRQICERYAPGRAFRIVEIRDPERDRDPTDYHAAVSTWHERRTEVYAQLLAQHLGEQDCGAFLVWGDPCLYDSTLRIVEQIVARGLVALEYEVLPGITSIQALAARHRIPLNQIGEPVQITTGRRLAQDSLGQARDVVVLLDGECAFTTVADKEVEIYWGAYLGMPDEIVLAGPVHELADKIQQVRAAARKRKGWIMDIYLLRRRGPPPR